MGRKAIVTEGTAGRQDTLNLNLNVHRLKSHTRLIFLLFFLRHFRDFFRLFFLSVFLIFFFKLL